MLKTKETFRRSGQAGKAVRLGGTLKVVVHPLLYCDLCVLFSHDMSRPRFTFPQP